MERRGVKYFRVHGKRGKIRYVEAHPAALPLIQDYLDAAKYQDEVFVPELLAGLKARGFDTTSNTLLVVMGDHGRMDPSQYGRGEALQQQDKMRVPLLFVGPGIAPGQRHTLLLGPEQEFSAEQRAASSG